MGLLIAPHSSNPLFPSIETTVSTEHVKNTKGSVYPVFRNMVIQRDGVWEDLRCLQILEVKKHNGSYFQLMKS